VTLIHEYALEGSLADNLGGPSLTSLGGVITGSGYVFGPEQGLVFTSPTFTPADYSLELSFEFQSVSSDRKVADFLNFSSDSGLYVLDGSLNFNPLVTATASDFVAGVPVDLVLTRNGSTGIVTGYVNGAQRFTFADTGSLAVAQSGSIRLFVDDLKTIQVQASGGILNYARVFNGALSSAEVNALYLSGAPAVPEPPVALLLMLGGLGVGAWRVRFNRRNSRLPTDAS